MQIGIPRSLFFPYYSPFWLEFWRELAIPCLISPPTTQSILHKGLSAALDEICLPVKIHYGHLAYLEDKVEIIFSPAFGKWGKKGHFCPKLKAVHDLVKYKFPKAVEFWHNLNEQDMPLSQLWQKTVFAIAPQISKKRFKTAWKKACQRQTDFLSLWEKGYNPTEAAACLLGKKNLPSGENPHVLKIAVLGHPYLVYDEMPNHGLLTILRQKNARVYTKEQVPAPAKRQLWPAQTKELFWPLGQQLLGAALYYSTEKRVDGIIFLTACLCGPDAMIGELLEKYMSRLPEAPSLLKLTVDEHTGQAGIETRIEAFVDLLYWRKRHAAI